MSLVFSFFLFSFDVMCNCNMFQVFVALFSILYLYNCFSVMKFILFNNNQYERKKYSESVRKPLFSQIQYCLTSIMTAC